MGMVKTKMTAKKTTNKGPASESDVTPELKEQWRKMAAWERAAETVFRREWELVDAKARLRQAKKNLKHKQTKQRLRRLLALSQFWRVFVK